MSAPGPRAADPHASWTPRLVLVGEPRERAAWRAALAGLPCRLDERGAAASAAGDDAAGPPAVIVVVAAAGQVAAARRAVDRTVPMPFIIAVGPAEAEPLRRGADAVCPNERSLLRAQVGAALRRAARQRRFLSYAEHLAERAYSDRVTGLANRAGADEALGREVARARRHRRPLSLALADVDRFKSVNDVHGHAAGDRVLRQVAALLREGARAGELVGRWGGEEFVWLLPETGLDEARSACERARRAIAATEIDEVGGVTVSFGVATLRPGEEPGDLVRRADAALYRAKREGRDRVAAEGPAAAPGAPEEGGRIARYLRAALGSDRDELARIAAEALARGGPVGLYGELVEPALDEAGRRWERGTLSVGGEHLVTSHTEEVIRLAGPPPRASAGPVAVLGAAPANAHRLGLVAASDLLARCGWRTVSLGELTPLEALADAAVAMGAALIGVSAATDADLDDLGQRLPELTALAPGVLVAVGGSALRRRPDWVPPAGIHVAARARDVIALARALAPGVAPPSLAGAG